MYALIIGTMRYAPKYLHEYSRELLKKRGGKSIMAFNIPSLYNLFFTKNV